MPHHRLLQAFALVAVALVGVAFWIARHTLLALALALLLAGVANADRLPELEGGFTWSSRACASAGVEIAEPLRVPLLQLYAAAHVALRRVCGAAAAAELPAGAAPSYLGAGVALVAGWRRPGFLGYGALAVDAGAADVEQLWQVGAHGRLDLDYVLLYGDVRGFGGAPLAWGFGARVRPYVRFVEVWFDCDSRDGASSGRAEPCGLGAALRLHLPSTPVDVLAAVKVAFFDLSGAVGEVGERAMLTLQVQR